MRSLRYFTVLLAVVAAAPLDRTAAQNTSGSTFRVFVRGAETGIEEASIMESASGWTLRGSGKMRGSINLSTDYWEARYDRSWKPIELAISLSEPANRWTIRTSFSGTTATSEVVHNGSAQQRTHTVSEDTIAIPNLVFAAYEVLAARLTAAQPGARFDAYIAPQDSVTFTADKVTNESIQVPGRVIDARRWTLGISDGSAKLEMEIWTEGSRLLRLDIPSQMLSVLRDDIASVSARVITLGRPNDEQVAVPANGFSLAATLSRPPGVVAIQPADRKSPQARLPAVVLVSGSGASDRDEFVAGIPIFAQLANAIADAGHLVVRFDERGVGQSGGRAESATLDEFAADVRAVVTYLDKRRDVDPKRIALVGYGEGGWVALLVASREPKVAALGLVGVPAITGTELVLEQQRMMFERTGMSPEAQQAAVEQQKKILDAVVSGKGWENLTLDVRRRVDTPLYRSFLMFEPAQTMTRVRQPVLVIQPMMDREVPVYHGEQLAQLARSRPRAKTTDFVQLDGVNHLLARATTGDVAEYATLAQRSVTPAATLEIISWLAKTLPAAAQK